MNTPRIAIETRVLPTTHHRGTRIKADDGHGHTFVMPWGHGKNDRECHRIVATLLRDKMGWDEFDMVCGMTKRGMVWVLVDKPDPRLSLDAFVTAEDVEHDRRAFLKLVHDRIGEDLELSH